MASQYIFPLLKMYTSLYEHVYQQQWNWKLSSSKNKIRRISKLWTVKFTFNLVAERAGFVLIKHNGFGGKLNKARRPLGGMMKMVLSQWSGVREAHGPWKWAWLTKPIGELSGEPPWPGTRAWAEGPCLKKSWLSRGGGGSGARSGGNGSGNECNSVNPSHSDRIGSNGFVSELENSGIWLGFTKGLGVTGFYALQPMRPQFNLVFYFPLMSLFIYRHIVLQPIYPQKTTLLFSVRLQNYPSYIFAHCNPWNVFELLL